MTYDTPNYKIRREAAPGRPNGVWRIIPIGTDAAISKWSTLQAARAEVARLERILLDDR